VYTFTSLEIPGYRSEAVPNTFIRQGEPAAELGVILPGVAYSADMPVLYYSGALLLEGGADLLRVDYRYNRPGASGDERAQRLLADVSAALAAGLAQRPYSRITLVGKSVGTLAMGRLLATEPRLREARAVWLTPLLTSAELLQDIAVWGGRSLFVIGTADHQYDPDLLAQAVSATRGESLVIPGANHSLEFPGDVLASLAALERLVRAVQAFLG
jgi:hypothetical protein